MDVAEAVKQALTDHIKLSEGLNSPDFVSPESEASFFVADLDDIVRKWALWKASLPEVTPFFGTYLTLPCPSRPLPEAGQSTNSTRNSREEQL